MKRRKVLVWIACRLIVVGLAILHDQKIRCRECDHITGHFRVGRAVYIFTCDWSGLTTEMVRPVCPAFKPRTEEIWRIV